jgi:hypothetical protein
MKRTLTFAALMTLGAAALAPLPASAQTSFSVVIGNAPPPPRFESVPAPRRGYVWAPGFWNWDGHRHVWMSGHWENAREGYRFQGTQWVRDPGGYRLEQGGWIPMAGGGYNEIVEAPPAPRYERVPAYRPGYIWEPGHWEWRGNRHEWIGGVWLVDRPGYVYNRPSWYERDGRWYMEQGRWTPRGQDRDRDGIPDRYERHAQQRGHDRDRDGVPDRYDRDRDGDGVPNRADRRPDDGRRY